MGDWKGHKRHLLPPIATVIAMNIKDFGGLGFESWVGRKMYHKWELVPWVGSRCSMSLL
jgi:hypothetical protein